MQVHVLYRLRAILGTSEADLSMIEPYKWKPRKLRPAPQLAGPRREVGPLHARIYPAHPSLARSEDGRPERVLRCA
jgi:hypothetical protein